MLALPGGAYVYQGEELGLAEVEDIPEDLLQDPVWGRSGHTARGRDGCRVPLPWSGHAPPFGFTEPDVRPWLPQPARWAGLTAERQRTDPSSMLSLYRTALALRRELVVDESLRWADAPDGVLAFDRGPSWRCVVNLSPSPVDLPGHGTPLLVSGPAPDGTLPPDTAAWTRR
jgi:alpha-glucosidase